MADVVEKVETQFDVVDRATRPLMKIADMARKVGKIFDSVSNTVLAVGGIGGLFALKETIGEINETYRAVGRVKAMTGMAAEQAHAMLDSFELAGIETESAERIILGMTRKTEQLSDGMGGAAKHVEQMSEMYKQLGINMKAGPQETLIGMAKAAEKGKLNVDQTMKLFGVGRSQAVSLYTMLKRGPEAIKKDMADTLKSGDLITEGALNSFKQMQRARRELKDTWQELVGTIYKGIVPGLTKMLQLIKERIDALLPAAQKFGAFLSKHMDAIVKSAGLFLKLMAANKIVNLLTGHGGIGGMIGAVLTAVPKKGLVGGLTAAAGEGGILGGVMKMVPMLSGLFKGASALGPVVSGLLRLSVVGVVIFLIVKAVQTLIKHFGEFSGILHRMWNTVASQFHQIYVTLKPVIDALMAAGAWLFENLVIGGLKTALTVLSGMLDYMIIMGKALGIALSNIIDAPLKSAKKMATGEFWADTFSDAKKQLEEERASYEHFSKQKAAKMTAASKDQGAGVYQDFRGSKFDIKQAFAEGFDPDRVAVAFAKDLSALGERQMQSGFAPLFSVR